MTIETLPLTTLGSADSAVVDDIKRPMTHHEDGVYFGLDEDEYHADPALGSTDLRHLLISGSDYWWRSKHNPLRSDEETLAVTNGHALHCRVLFGEEEFNRRYVRALSREDYPNALITIDDLKRALKEINASVTGAKPELISRLQNMSSKFQIWDVMVGNQLASGKIILKPNDYDRIMVSSAMITKNPSLERCFQHGYPEVSVFWTHDGVRFKGRFDYLLQKSIVDLKSFTNRMDKPVELAIKGEFWNKRLDIQATHYINARHLARAHISMGNVFGNADLDWVRRVADDSEFTFIFVFYTVNGAPIARGWRYDPGTITDGIAAAEISKAVQIFKEFRDRFGEDMWVDQEPIHTMTEDDVPFWVRGAP